MAASGVADEMATDWASPYVPAAGEKVGVAAAGAFPT